MKVSIIGPGAVGMTLAYTLMLRRIAREIVLVGRNREKAEGEALDMMHAQAFLQVPVRVDAGDVEDVAGSEVVVMCASVPVPPGITDRNEMARGNVLLMKELLPRVAEVAPEAKLLMVTNPVDPLTWLAMELTGFPPERVMGTGTLVDSIRFRELLSGMLSIHPDDLRAYILGEHGERQFPAMSVAQSGGERIEDTAERRALCERAKGLGIEVFRKKGNTCYAIALAAAYVLESMLMNERRTMPLSVKIDGFLGVEGVCLSLPVVVGKQGIERVIRPDLNELEQESFREAAKVVRQVIEAVG
ncbi:L-lactate dehydrogenase [Haloferula luteola]|uniref:L-lactate dehydrogenase n=1 Tax=Haloferula luteola TaxID=595692 RepID=A0A840VEJ1_9BACT|nr:lactate dehydrogenase [Haloferula luteola]MBB5352249.1 L-lactate dehydrogenase [Haloferula luteola]